MEFRLCSYDSPRHGDLEVSERGGLVEVTQDCLDRGLMELLDGGTRLVVSGQESVGGQWSEIQSYLISSVDIETTTMINDLFVKLCM